MSDFHSGFIALTGRPNAGKSTLLNHICKDKIAAVSNKPQTTRSQVRGIMNRSDAQLVFIDTPGIHKPVSELGKLLNKSAFNAIFEVDISCLIIDALATYGRGDLFIAQKMDKHKSVVILNKTDKAKPHQIATQLRALADLDFLAYFPVSAKTGEGVDVLIDYLVAQLPSGAPFYGKDMIMDKPEAFWVAEMVREQLFELLSEELPYSVATQVVEYDWPRVRCEIYVERESQKGIVIGKGGKLLKQVGQNVRKQMPKGAFLELFVKIDKNWQSKPKAVKGYGYGES